MFYTNRKEKKAGVAVLIANKKDFKTKVIIRDKEEYSIMIKEQSNERI